MPSRPPSPRKRRRSNSHPHDVATVRNAELSRELQLSGTLSPLVETTVRARVSGEMLEMTVREGQVVHRGDVLARIDTRNQLAQSTARMRTCKRPARICSWRS